MGQGSEDFRLIDLTMRFDTGENRRNQDRFKPDPANSDPVRPDPNTPAPARPITNHLVVADLFRRGNLNYAGFIHDCTTAVGKKTRRFPKSSRPAAITSS